MPQCDLSKHLIVTGWSASAKNHGTARKSAGFAPILEGRLLASCHGFRRSSRRIAHGRGRILRKIVGQQTTVLASFFETHVHNLKGHVLRAVVAHKRGGLQVSQAY